MRIRNTDQNPSYRAQCIDQVKKEDLTDYFCMAVGWDQDSPAETGRGEAQPADLLQVGAGQGGRVLRRSLQAGRYRIWETWEMWNSFGKLNFKYREEQLSG